VLYLLTAVLVLAWTAPAPAGAAGAAAAGLLAELPAQWRDDQGRSVRLDSLSGERVIFTMAYANCHRICPLTMQHLQQLQQQLDARGSTARFVIVGFDPVGDDPQAWHQFRTSRRLTRDNWLFLSGRSTEQVRAFAARLGFDYWKYDDHVIHDGRVVVLDPQGRLQSSFGPGAVLDAAAIAGDPDSSDSRGS
jgi:protein SCO1/2